MNNKSLSICILVYALLLAACAGQAAPEPTVSPTAPSPTATPVPPTPTPSAEDLYLRGSQYLETGDFKQAVDAYTQALTLEPDNSAIYLDRAMAYLELDRLEDAQADIATASELGLPELDMAALIVRAKDFRDRQKFKQATTCYDLALEIDSESVDALNNRALVYADTQKYARAVADCNRSVKLDPEYSESYLIRAHVYQLMGKTEQSITDLERTLELNPEESLAYYRLSGFHYDEGEYELALEDLNSCIELDDQNYEALILRGNTFDFMGELHKAIADYDQAMQLEPDRPEAYTERGTAYRRNGDIDLAIADLNQALELDPQAYQPLLQRGKAYFYSGEWERAIQDFTAALEADPGSQYARIIRANAYLLNNEDELARKELENLSEQELDPSRMSWVNDLTYGLEKLPDAVKLPEVDDNLVDPGFMLSLLNENILLQDQGDWVFIREVDGYVIPIPKGWYGGYNQEFGITSFGYDFDDAIDFGSVRVDVFDECNQAIGEVSGEIENAVETIDYIDNYFRDIPDVYLTTRGELPGAAFIAVMLQGDQKEVRLFIVHDPIETEGLSIFTGNMSSGEFSNFNLNNLCTPYLVFSSPEGYWSEYEAIYRIIAQNWYGPDGEFLGVELPESLLNQP